MEILIDEIQKIPFYSELQFYKNTFSGYPKGRHESGFFFESHLKKLNYTFLENEKFFAYENLKINGIGFCGLKKQFVPQGGSVYRDYLVSGGSAAHHRGRIIFLQTFFFTMAGLTARKYLSLADFFMGVSFKLKA